MRFLVYPLLALLLLGPASAVAHERAPLLAHKSDVLARELYCLAASIYFEARSEEKFDQLAVAQVVLNRVRDRDFPGSVCEVVLERGQFSFVRNETIPEAPVKDVPGEIEAWEKAQVFALLASLGLSEEVVSRDALYFCAPRTGDRCKGHRARYVREAVFSGHEFSSPP